MCGLRDKRGANLVQHARIATLVTAPINGAVAAS